MILIHTIYMCIYVSIFVYMHISLIYVTWFTINDALPRFLSQYDMKISKNTIIYSLQWRHNRRDSVSNHQPHHCLLNGLFRRRSKKISKLRVTGLCAGNSPGTGEFPAQMASNAENVSIWWRHNGHTHMCKHRCSTYWFRKLHVSVHDAGKSYYDFPVP